MNHFFLLLLLGGTPTMSSAVEIVAHRGAAHEAPENTLASVNLAWQQGADAVEIDVYLSKDRRIVVIHDDTTKRTAGIDWKVAEHSLAELKTLDLGRWKGEKWAGERMPTLEEVLATIPAGKRLLIEIKCGPEIVPELACVLQTAAKQPAQTVVISFDYEVVSAVKKALPQLRVLWLLDETPERDKKTGAVLVSLKEQIDRCRAAGLDGLNVGRESHLDESVVRQIRAAGLTLHVWTVNEAADARRFAALGVDSITTDRPDWLRAELSASSGGG